MTAGELAAAVRDSRGFRHKHDLSEVMSALQSGVAATLDAGRDGFPAISVANGDDCAAIPDGEGHLLFAIEGFVEDFVQQQPWFAGYCGIMVNVSDIYAMGGRPLAVVDALWSEGMHPAGEILAGLRAAAGRYGVPLVGGHSNNRAARGQLAVAILGRAQRLLTSFAARPGDRLVMAVDLRGRYQDPFPYWNASTEAPPARLRADLEILAELAERGLCDAAKDISMAGTLGTLLMLLECSRVGASIDVATIPRPAGADGGAGAAPDDDATAKAGAHGPDVDHALLRWLTAFPSYGFILSVRPELAASVLAAFHARDLAAVELGVVTTATRLDIRHRGGDALLWDWAAEPFMAAGHDPAPGYGPAHRRALA